MSVVDASRRAVGGGRRAEGWPTEHTEHTEGFLTGGNGEDGRRRAEDWPTEHTEHTEEFLTGGNGEDGRRRAEGGGLAAKKRKRRKIGRNLRSLQASDRLL